MVYVYSLYSTEIDDFGNFALNSYQRGDWTTSIEYYGENLYSGGWDKDLRVIQSNYDSLFYNGLKVITSLCVSEFAVAFTYLNENSIVINLNLTGGTLVLNEQIEGPINCLTSPGNNILISGGEDNSILIWEKRNPYDDEPFEIRNRFVCNSSVISLHSTINGDKIQIIAGDRIGNLYSLIVNN